MFSTPGPLLHFPTTPKSHSHHPLSSSPLSAVSPSPSPTTKAQARRRSQYKSTAPLPSSSTAPRRSSVAYTSNRRRSSPADATSFVRGNLFGPPTTEKKTDEETPRNVLLRDRFRQRCFERAQRARESKIRKGRKFSASSDDGDMDMDDEDDDGEVDAFLDDEIYRRIIMSTQRKREHAYRVSYQHDVGSSFDPDMEDPVEWEQDLRGTHLILLSRSYPI
ncbi:hypothetical protein OF83DRAFT_1110396 [Amylostereum chailletii]|nr:hypothetical protein OF83DRAFT_1110396 [Amylostereum chailletii]